MASDPPRAWWFVWIRIWRKFWLVGWRGTCPAHLHCSLQIQIPCKALPVDRFTSSQAVPIVVCKFRLSSHWSLQNQIPHLLLHLLQFDKAFVDQLSVELSTLKIYLDLSHHSPVAVYWTFAPTIVKLGYKLSTFNTSMYKVFSFRTDANCTVALRLGRDVPIIFMPGTVAAKTTMAHCSESSQAHFAQLVILGLAS